ncbi:uncharacterized protein LOC109602203 [Aethina tumida]|uniref:uncharacterized protein LOC109602203 n=1 Tax=Aethina tumida TaxID=116153 RepID=UPI0021480FD8|nr:uncharacterized protein LOC109602203 [Aethina tumida]
MTDSVPSDIIALGNKIAAKIGIDNVDVILHSGNAKGEGYLGEIVFLELKDKTNGKCQHVVVKRAFTNKQTRDTNPIRETFLNEIYFYDDILPALQRFQVENGFEKFDKISKCFLTSREDTNEYMVLENIKKIGFELFDKTKILSYQHMEIIYKNYAYLHATSFLYRKYKTKEFDKLLGGLYDLYEPFMKIEYSITMWTQMFQMASEKLIPGEDDEVIAAFDKYLKDGIEIFRRSWYYQGKYPLLTHGDCWSNNMMFKYDEKRNVVDLKLLDWQITKVGSPVHDLSYCLYSGASLDTYERLDDLLKLYYEHFSAVLRQAGENPEEVYPFSVLKEEWKEYCKFGWTMSLMVMKIKTTEQEDKLDLVDISTSDNKIEMAKKMVRGTPSTEYDRRARELLLHVYKIGGM